MTIISRDQLINALANNASRLVIDKASISSAAAGQFFSTWRAAGQPGVGAIPTTPAACDNTTVGSFDFAQQTAPATSYGAYAYATGSNSATTVEIHDRLVHMGGLSGTATTAQTVNLDASLGTDNLPERKGVSNFAEVQWWLEVYTALGSTGVNATVSVLYDDDSPGTLLAVPLGATPRAGRMYPLNGFLPVAAAGRYIKKIVDVTLSASTGTVGNFGFTATRPRMTLPLVLANKAEFFDWAQLGLPDISNGACLMLVVLCGSTSTGTIRGGVKLAHG